MWKEWAFCVYHAWNQENLKAALFMLLAKESGICFSARWLGF